MIGLAREMIYRVRPAGPLAETAGSPRGSRRYWQMAEAELGGPRIRARTTMPGGDWMSVGPDGFWRPDVRVQFVTDDGATVLLHYTGLVEQNDIFKREAERAGRTEFGDHYMRMMLDFDTGAPQYQWLNRSLFLAEGRLDRGWIEYAVYRVT